MAETLRPVLAVTLGDVAGIGPELLVRAWGTASLHAAARLWVFGDPKRLHVEAQRQSRPLRIIEAETPAALPDDPAIMPVFSASGESLDHVPPGRADARAGKAAYDFLVTAIDQTRAGAADGIVTLPLHKEGLRLAGLDYPGHTEILAERTGVGDYAMMLYRRNTGDGPRPGLGVVHVTLHRALRDVFAGITVEGVAAKARLLDQMLRRLGHSAPKIGVAALNPHAGDGGLFGDEEITILRPAVDRALAAGVDVTGPLPADTLFVRAVGGEFDGVVAQYHDQGHIALKLLGWKQAVNITVGLPIIRTSVAHGTAYDIVGKDLADPASLKEAVTIARQLVLAAQKEKACVLPS